MITFEAPRADACFASAASALEAFFAASLAARFWASREREEVCASRASVGVVSPILGIKLCSLMHHDTTI